MDLISAFLTLLFVMDPLGNVPVFIAALKDVAPERRQKVIRRELLIALVVLLAFLFLGHYLLDALGIEQESIRITGAIILFIIALRMIFPGPPRGADDIEGEPFIVPMAVPYVAGPSTLAILMIMVKSEGGVLWQWALVMFAAWLITAVVLYMSVPIAKKLGEKGTRAVERLMGMLLIMMSVQMFINAMRELSHGAF